MTAMIALYLAVVVAYALRDVRNAVTHPAAPRD
jgi:hypothetical protein